MWYSRREGQGIALTVVNRHTVAVAAVCLALTSVTALAAETSGNAALRQQVMALDSLVRSLQARIERLEARSGQTPESGSIAPEVSSSGIHTAPVPAAAASRPAVAQVSPGTGYISPEARLRQNWSRVQPAMANARVVELLGEPSRKFKIDGRTVWYYYYPATGAGSVFFNDNGLVSSRQTPFGWGW